MRLVDADFRRSGCITPVPYICCRDSITMQLGGLAARRACNLPFVFVFSQPPPSQRALVSHAAVCMTDNVAENEVWRH